MTLLRLVLFPANGEREAISKLQAAQSIHTVRARRVDEVARTMVAVHNGQSRPGRHSNEASMRQEINKGLEVLSVIVRNASFDCAKLCDSGIVGPSDDARRVLWILPAADAFSFGRSITKKAECVIVALSRRLALKIVPTLRQPAIHHSVVQPQIDAFNWQNLRHGMLSKSWTIDRLQDDAKHKMIRFVRLYFR